MDQDRWELTDFVMTHLLLALSRAASRSSRDEVIREIVDRLVVEQDSRRQPTLDDLLQRSRNLNGGARVEAVGVERLGRVDLVPR